jgi:hypothetical protein
MDVMILTNAVLQMVDAAALYPTVQIHWVLDFAVLVFLDIQETESTALISMNARLKMAVVLTIVPISLELSIVLNIPSTMVLIFILLAPCVIR